MRPDSHGECHESDSSHYSMSSLAQKSHVSINKKNNHHKNCLLVDINNLVKFHFEFGCKTLLVFDYA